MCSACDLKDYPNGAFYQTPRRGGRASSFPAGSFDAGKADPEGAGQRKEGCIPQDRVARVRRNGHEVNKHLNTGVPAHANPAHGYWVAHGHKFVIHAYLIDHV